MKSSASCLRLFVVAFLPVTLIAAAVFASAALAAQPSRPDVDVDDLQRLFASPPADSRIMMRWWWFGPAVNKAELEREMRLMKEGGIGGFEVQPVYPVALDDAARGIRNLAFLSDEFIDALRFAADKARELGLRIDLTLGSGWPYGGPQVSIDHAAGKLRHQRTAVTTGSRRIALPSIGAGEQLIAVFFAPVSRRSDSPNAVRELTAIRDGVVDLPADLDGPGVVQFFIASRTGMMVKRPAIGAEGFVLNHYDRPAVDAYLRAVGDRLMQAFGGTVPYAIFSDSLEVYESDWTADFLDEFRKRRGYDLKPHLPSLVAGTGRDAPAIRHDWGQTLTELLEERFVVPLQRWSQAHGTRLRLQGYGIPPATLSTGAHADLPEGEGAQWKSLSSTRWASSASHIYGRPVTSSETWTWLHSPSFRATPLDVKAEADLHFLQGVTQLIGHGWPYTAEGVEYPGWRFYAAGVFNEKNPWWIVMPDVARYLQRLSFLLRQGEPANDVAIYLPTADARAHFSPGRVNLIETLRDRLGPNLVASVLEAGFGFDFFDDDALRTAGHVESGTLRLGTNRYRAVILPGVERIPLATLRALDELARGGGVLIATRRFPDRAPGFLASEADHAQIRSTSERLFVSAGPAATLVQDERAQLGGALNRRLRPDVALAQPTPDIGFVHRRSGSVEMYFVVNTGNVRRRVDATFRVDAMNAEWWDPIGGAVTPAPSQRAAGGGGSTISLDLEPYGSRVLVFSTRTHREPPRRVDSSQPPFFDISTGWSVAFDRHAKPVIMDRLRSWTDDETTRYFSGTATYEKDVVVPQNLIDGGRALRLELGDGQPIAPQPLRSGMQAWLDAPVRDAAVVFINDRRAGSVWCPPYSIDVTGLLTRGANRIRILVGNLAINHMAGHALPDYRLLNLRYGVRFEPQDMDKVQPVPAGLLGPIRLVAGDRAVR